MAGARCKGRVASAIVWGGASLGVLVLLGAVGLWFHYGTAVFFEMIAAGIRPASDSDKNFRWTGPPARWLSCRLSRQPGRRAAVMLWGWAASSVTARPQSRAVSTDRPDRPDRHRQESKGKPTLIFFGFTHCPDVCPTSLFEISEVLKAMGKDADG